MKFLPWIVGAALFLELVFMGDLLVLAIRQRSFVATIVLTILLLVIVALGILVRDMAQHMRDDR